LIAYIDSVKCYRFINRNFKEWFQVPQSSLLGRQIVDFIGAENYSRIEKYVERALAGEQVSYEQTMVYAERRNRDFHSTLVPDFDLEKNVVGYYALVIDITERKEA